MSNKLSPSYDFKVTVVPTIQNNFELDPDKTTALPSYDFLQEGDNSSISGSITDYVKASIGGTFFGIIKYGNTVCLQSVQDIPHIGWVMEYVQSELNNLINGSLFQASIKSLFSANSPLNYDPGSGTFSLDTNLSSFINDIGFITSEDLPEGQEVPQHILSITTDHISKWNTAYNWGNHANEGYLTEVTEQNVKQYEGALEISKNQITDFEHSHNLLDILDFPIPSLGLMVLRSNKLNSALEFVTLSHAMISGLNEDSNYLHLTSTQKNNIINPATTSDPGYMTAEQALKLENALTNFSVGSNLSFEEGVLNLNPSIKPVDDSSISSDSVWSSQKIVDYFNSQSNIDTGAFVNVFTIKLNTGTTVAQRITGLVEGVDYPTGWILTDDGADLLVTHNLDKLNSFVTVLSVNSSTQNVTVLQGNLAYSSYTCEFYNSGYNRLRISALGGGVTPVIIKLGF